MKGGFFPDIDKPSEPIAGNLHTYNFCEDLDISHSQIHSLRESSPPPFPSHDRAWRIPVPLKMRALRDLTNS